MFTANLRAANAAEDLADEVETKRKFEEVEKRAGQQAAQKMANRAQIRGEEYRKNRAEKQTASSDASAPRPIDEARWIFAHLENLCIGWKAQQSLQEFKKRFAATQKLHELVPEAERSHHVSTSSFTSQNEALPSRIPLRREGSSLISLFRKVTQ